ncbi:hypothetical protein [Priestia megaterium]|uniref:hypothetical protein n=1 Tax=Priestia megaterium TaxID=1404 RepID=UPI000BFD9BF6|nr:hypothetical protein [Priestia megaterium]PGO60751.1 hypothetical protein CN981_09445 [Priestia megaterium]
MNIQAVLPNYNWNIKEKRPVLNLRKFTASPFKEPINEVREMEIDNLIERQRVVYVHLRDVWKEGATARELAISLYKDGQIPSPERNSTHPRLNELVKIGLVKVIGKKTCTYTGKKVTIYQHTY